MSKLSFDKLSWVFCNLPWNFFWIFVKKWFFKFKCRFSWNKKPIFHLVRVSRESEILGLKNENPCFENFSGVSGSWEESQGFPEVKKSKYESGFLTMSSFEPMFSRTIFNFIIGWVEIKIFHFLDIGLEVERSQLVVWKISKWVFAHLLFSPPRTYSNWNNLIWMIITHFMIVRRFTSYRL